MRNLLTSAFLLVIGAVVALSTPLSAAADTSDFTFDSFDADYTLSRLDDGTSHLEVTETIVARFPDFDQNRGIIRAIPDDFDGVDLQTSVNSVTDESGTPVPFTEERTDGFVQLALGTDDFVYGAVTYVISYSQQNVVRSFDDTASDEFYWDVNGVGWDQPFERVSALVHVDASAAGEYTGNAACYVGAQGDTSTCQIDDTGASSGESALTFAASADNLSPRQTMTVAIGFTPDTFITPEPTVNVPRPVPFGFDLAAGGIGLLSLAGLAAAIVSRVRAGRQAKGRGIIIPQYSEPKDITILQSAHLIGRGTTAMPAALVRLAVRKNIRILAYAVKAGGEPYTLQFLSSRGTSPEDDGLIRLLFGANPEPGELREFGQGEIRLMSSLTAMSARAKSSLTGSGFLEPTPGRGTASALVAGQVILGMIAIAMLILQSETYLTISLVLLPVMAIGILAFVVSVVLSIRPLRQTRAGAEAREYLEGMRMYLTLAEKDRLRALQSPSGADRIDVGNNLEMIKLYEKLLPWAVLWGVEDQWMRELEVRVQAQPEQPDWFVGDSWVQRHRLLQHHARLLHGDDPTGHDLELEWQRRRLIQRRLLRRRILRRGRRRRRRRRPLARQQVGAGDRRALPGDQSPAIDRVALELDHTRIGYLIPAREARRHVDGASRDPHPNGGAVADDHGCVRRVWGVDAVPLEVGENPGDARIEAREELMTVGATRHSDIQLAESPRKYRAEVVTHRICVVIVLEMPSANFVDARQLDRANSAVERQRCRREVRANEGADVDPTDGVRLQRLGHQDGLLRSEIGEPGPGAGGIEPALHIRRSLAVPDKYQSHAGRYPREGREPSMRATISGASGWTVGRNRCTSPPGVTTNFSKFHLTLPALPAASWVLVSSW